MNGELIDVNTGEVKTGKAPACLAAFAIGSCVAVVMYEPRKRVGGMAHVMLPGRIPGEHAGAKTRYAEDAVDELCRQLTARGVNVKDCWVVAIGGGDILGRGDVFEKNVKSVMDYLKRLGLSPGTTLLGGTERRSVLLNLGTGKIFYTHGDSVQKEMIWEGGDASKTGS